MHFFPKNDWHSFRIFLIQIDKAHRVVDDAVDRDTLMKHNFVLKTWHTLEIIWTSKRSRKRTRTICSRKKKKKKESKKHSVVLLTTGCLKKKVRINQLVKKKVGVNWQRWVRNKRFPLAILDQGHWKLHYWLEGVQVCRSWMHDWSRCSLKEGHEFIQRNLSWKHWEAVGWCSKIDRVFAFLIHLKRAIGIPHQPPVCL